MSSKKQLTKHIVPWVDVTCSYCGVVAEPSGHFYKGIIHELRQYCSHSGWVQDVNTRECFCPDCQKEELI